MRRTTARFWTCFEMKTVGKNPVNIFKYKFDTRARKVGWLAVLYAVSWLNVFWPFVRFQSVTLNHLFFAIMQIIPWILTVVVASSVHWPGWRRWSLFSIFLVVGILSAPFGLLGVACAALEDDASFERLVAVPTLRGNVVAYRLNSGAIGSDGVIVRQECTVAPGVLVVRELVRKDAEDARIEAVGSSMVRVLIPVYSLSYSKGKATLVPLNGPNGTIDKVFHLALLPCLWNRTGEEVAPQRQIRSPAHGKLSR
jgi:uncharacterized membrane protein